MFSFISSFTFQFYFIIFFSLLIVLNELRLIHFNKNYVLPIKTFILALLLLLFCFGYIYLYMIWGLNEIVFKMIINYPNMIYLNYICHYCFPIEISCLIFLLIKTFFFTIYLFYILFDFLINFFNFNKIFSIIFLFFLIILFFYTNYSYFYFIFLFFDYDNWEPSLRQWFNWWYIDYKHDYSMSFLSFFFHWDNFILIEIGRFYLAHWLNFHNLEIILKLFGQIIVLDVFSYIFLILNIIFFSYFLKYWFYLKNIPRNTFFSKLWFGFFTFLLLISLFILIIFCIKILNHLFFSYIGVTHLYF